MKKYPPPPPAPPRVCRQNVNSDQAGNMVTFGARSLRFTTPAAGPTIHEDTLLWVCFPVFSTVCLELTATNSSHR